MKLNKFFKVIILAILTCLLPLPIISNVATNIHNYGVSMVATKATNDLYYGSAVASLVDGNDVEQNLDNESYIYIYIWFWWKFNSYTWKITIY